MHKKVDLIGSKLGLMVYALTLPVVLGKETSKTIGKKVDAYSRMKEKHGVAQALCKDNHGDGEEEHGYVHK